MLGASAVGYREFLIGTALGMAAMVVGLAGFGYQLAETWRHPSHGEHHPRTLVSLHSVESGLDDQSAPACEEWRCLEGLIDVQTHPFRSGPSNCWRIDRADRFSCVQDAADYFRLVRHAFLHARETIFILGWDIQSTLDLVPGGASDGAPTRLDELLKWVIRRRPQLACHVLIWDYAALYALEREPLAKWRLGWQMPRQVRFAFDDHHPIGGSHHQKIIVVDDVLAFCGGIDLTGHRWDTDRAPRRGAGAGQRDRIALRVRTTRYRRWCAARWPQVSARSPVVDGRRWAKRCRRLRPPHLAPCGPMRVEPDLTDIDVAIARTVPASESEPAIRECERLFVDSIAAARQSIYIESQYFTNDALGRALAARLQEPEGPEILLVIPKECHGWVEKQTMGALRDEVASSLDRWRSMAEVTRGLSRRPHAPAASPRSYIRR